MDTPRLYYGRSEPEAEETGGRLPTALAIPGDQGLAVSTLGWQVVYRMLALDPAFAVERFFVDKRSLARLGNKSDSLISADSKRPLSSFPLIAPSITFEEDYIQLVRMLDAAGVPALAAERPDLPLVVAGGPVAFLNPAPIAPFVDAFWVGEAEGGLLELFHLLKDRIFEGADKQDILQEISTIEGVYVPGLTKGKVKRVLAPTEQNSDGALEVNTLNHPAYSCFISDAAAFRDTLLLEVNRGCPYGCRFCAAGYIYRPPRHAKMEDLKTIVEYTNPPKVGLVGTALTDWPDLMPFLNWLQERKTKFSLSSMRADGLTEEFLVFLRKCGVRTITLALEGASDRIRNMANKRLKKEDVLKVVELAAKLGINHLRLYMIIGWPGETDEDYQELDSFFQDIIAARAKGQGKKKKQFMRITLGASSLVPKPWTPFQWAPCASEKHLNEIHKKLKKMVKPLKGVAISGDNPFQARLQTVLSRGGEDIAEFISLAARNGGWKKGYKLWDHDFSEFIDEEIPYEKELPWDVIDMGVSKEYLRKEWLRGQESKISPTCPAKGCSHCGRCECGEIVPQNNF
ncbi:MAG: radical SAM protein [Desulfovibrio sp.]